MSLVVCSLDSSERVCINCFEDACPKGSVLWQSDAYLKRF